MPKIETKRVTLNVRESGAGFPLVLVHGWPESGYCWERVLPHLGSGFRVIRPDLRGLGDSERGGVVADYHKAALAQDVLAVLDALQVERFGLVGHDWGGAVAQEMAIAAPERVSRLCLMNIMLVNNPAGFLKAEEAHGKQRHRALWYQNFMQVPGLSEALVPGNEEAWLRTFLRFKDDQKEFPADAVSEYVRCYAIPGTPLSGANYYRAMREEAPRWRALAGQRFPMPALLLFGRHDPVVIPEYLEGHQECFDDVTVQWVEASHFVQEERPDEVGRALEEFFAPLRAG